MFPSSSSSSSTRSLSSTSLNHYFYTEILPLSSRLQSENYFTPVLKQNRTKTGWNRRYLSVSRSTLTLALDKSSDLLVRPSSCKYCYLLTSPSLIIEPLNLIIQNQQTPCVTISSQLVIAFDSPWERENFLEFLFSSGVSSQKTKEQENWNPNLIIQTAKEELMKALPNATRTNENDRIVEQNKRMEVNRVVSSACSLDPNVSFPSQPSTCVWDYTSHERTLSAQLAENEQTAPVVHVNQ
jgi:hypothetical protein